MYKVVNTLDGKKMSAIATGSAAIEYEENEWCEVPEFLSALHRGPFVFTDLENAITFVTDNDLGQFNEIWECEVENPGEPGGFLDIFELADGNIDYILYATFPRNTVECDRIKLIKRVS